MATQVIMSCPTCGLPSAALEAEYRRNTAEDRAHHLHISINEAVQCTNVVTPHHWMMKGELIVEPNGR